MTPIVIRSSRLKHAGVLVVGLCFVMIGVLVLLKRGNVGMAGVVGWLNILLFGAGSLFYARKFFDSSPRLVIDDQGILDQTLGVGVIPWSEIAGAYLTTIGANPFICLELRNLEYWLGRLSPTQRALTSANKKLGAMEFNLNLIGVDADPAQVLTVILKTLAEKRQRID